MMRLVLTRSAADRCVCFEEAARRSQLGSLGRAPVPCTLKSVTAQCDYL